MSASAVFDYVLPYLKTGPVLDAGCGLGGMLKLLPPGSEGLELSHEFVERCLAEGLNVRQADLNSPLPCESQAYNGVLCASVLEHIEAPIKLLRKLNRVLKPGGTVCIGLARESWIIDWRRPYFRNNPYHYYAFSMNNIAHLLLQCGFHLERFIFDPPFPCHFAGKLLGYVINRLPWNMGFGICVYFWTIARKVAEYDNLNGALQTNKILERRWLDMTDSENH